MLTLQKLKDMPPHTIFSEGIATDNEDGLFMNNSGKELRWVAVRGGIHDWCIYCHYAQFPANYIARSGDKVTMEHHIKALVPCDDEAFKMYRY